MAARQRAARRVRSHRHPAGAARRAEIEVTFDIDAERHRQRHGQGHGDRQGAEIRIPASGGLTEDEIERMVQGGRGARRGGQEAARGDRGQEPRRQPDLHDREDASRSTATRSSAQRRSAIEPAVADLRGVLDSEDAEAIKAKTEALAQASMKLGEAMYRAQQAAAPRRCRRPAAGPTAVPRRQRRGRGRRRLRGGRGRQEEVGLIGRVRPCRSRALTKPDHLAEVPVLR